MNEKENYVIDVESINEIIKFKELSEIPNSAPEIIGCLKHRNKIAPIYDFEYITHGKKNELNDQKIIIIIEVDNEQEKDFIGLLVNEVKNVLNIEEEKIEESPSYAKLNKGYINLEDKILNYLDINKITNLIPEPEE
tara:strand:- start:725 stop:1135 length:411 start_codon:yes stop_codon:yes gene_type:complete